MKQVDWPDGSGPSRINQHWLKFLSSKNSSNGQTVFKTAQMKYNLYEIPYCRVNEENVTNIQTLTTMQTNRPPRCHSVLSSSNSNNNDQNANAFNDNPTNLGRKMEDGISLS